MKDNRGFSLVEIMVAIAIIGVLIGASVLSINMVTRANVDKGMKLVTDGMSKLQTECLSKSKPTYMFIYQDSSDGDYYMKYSKTLHTSVSDIMSDSQEAEMIEDDNVVLYYIIEKQENGINSINLISGNNFVAITYNKGDSSVIAYANGSTKLSTLIRIEAGAGDKEAYVNIAYETGKVNFSNKRRSS